GFAEHVAAALGREKGPEAPPIRPVARRDQGLPLSFAQQRLWFIDHFDPGSALYNVPAALRLKGRLDPGALGRALSEIVRRHEVLRTTFATAGGEPVQVVGPARALPFPLCDLAGLAAPDREAVARGLLLAEAGRPFDLARGPVLRAGLLRLSAGPGDGREHLLVLTVHHIAFDGWSADIFLNELSVLYQANSAGQASPLAELRVQYADFAVWQRQWLSGEVLEQEL
ncbi:MAG: non-ribosomal peptide synthetase, partial [bacterium]|nr:non-ribosomal peptide synthetase [bacterium]